MTADTNKRYPIWQAPFQAFYNKDFYRDVAYNWKGFGITYLMLLCFVAQAISLAPMGVTCFAAAKNPQLSEFLKQVPRVTIADGKLSIDKPAPFDIKDPKTGTLLAQFRTDQTGTPQFKDNDPPILITQDVFAIDDASKSNDPRVIEFTNFAVLGNKLSFDGNDIFHFINNALIAMPILLFVVGTPLIWVGHLFQAAIYGGIAMLICKNMETPITYETGMRMAAIAITPNVVLSVLLAVTAQFARGVGVISFVMMFASIGIAITYLVVAAVSLKQPASPQPGDIPAAR